MDSSPPTAQKNHNRLVFLIAQKGSLRRVEQFLTNREFQVFSTDNLMEALQLVSDHAPEFVLVAVDHPNRTIQNFCQSIRQLFGATVIGFSESTNNQIFSLMAELALPFNISPPISGPSVLRMIAKIASSLEQTKMKSKPSRFEQTLATPDSKSREDETPSFSALSQLATMQSQNGQAAVAQTNFMMNFGTDSTTKYGYFPSGPDGAPDANGARMLNPDSLSTGADPLHQDTNFVGSFSPVEKSPQLLAAQALFAATQKVLGQILKEETEAFEVSLPTQDLQIEKIDISQQVACLAIQSADLTGYLVVAFGKNRLVDGNLVLKIRREILSQLVTPIEMESLSDHHLNLNISPVSFFPFAEMRAEFLLNSIHDSREVAVAFFTDADVDTQITASLDQFMVKVPIEEIADEVPLEFDYYIYLPVNKKYVLYNRRGNKSYSSQVERLKSGGHNHIHMHRDNVPDFKRYRAQVFLNRKIKDYQPK